MVVEVVVGVVVVVVVESESERCTGWKWQVDAVRRLERLIRRRARQNAEGDGVREAERDATFGICTPHPQLPATTACSTTTYRQRTDNHGSNDGTRL